MASAPPTAIRPAEAPREKSRSRRDGTWKECTTRTVTKQDRQRVDRPCVMPRRGGLTAWKNQTQAAMAPTATMTFTHPGGRARVAYEKAMPGRHQHHGAHGRRPGESPAGRRRRRSPPAPRTRQAEPQPDGVLGQPGLVGPADRFDELIASTPRRDGGRSRRRRRHGPGQPPAGAAPVRTGAEDRARRPRSCRGARAPPVEEAHDGAERPFGHPLGRLGVRGSATVTVTGSAAGCSSSRTISSPGMGRRPPVDLAPGVARHVGAGAPGQTHVGPGPIEGVTGPFVRAHGHAASTAAAAGRHVQRGRQGQRAPAASTIAARTVPPRRRRGSTASWTPRRTGTQRDDVVGRAAPAGRPDEASGPGRLDGADAQPGSRLDPHLHRQAGAAVAGRAPHADPRPGQRPRRDRRSR